ncbi:MAG TPA: universal stress protein [Sphingomicrobium sp.]|nr:universal stress protein [Sphingomicrobium sp.]
MKNVLLLLHDDDGQEGRLQVALDLTRALAGHLTCLDVVVPPVVLPEYYLGPGQLVPLVAAREREAENVARLRTRLEREDVSWDIQEVIGDPADRLEDAAELADVIVVSTRTDRPEISVVRGLVDALAAKSGRLVLAVPPGCNGLDVAGRALVSWDDSHEANQALRAVVPLLQLADTVTLLEVNPPGNEFAAQDAATYLARHRVHPIILQETTTGTVVDAVLNQAKDSGASYLVMGAFGHGRAIEAIFGGVTAGILTKSTFPVFLHH